MSPKHPDYIDCENWLYKLLKVKPRMRAVWVIPEHSYPIREGDNLGQLPNFSYIRYSEFKGYWKRMSGDCQVVTSYTCRSGAWTPPWADETYQRFLDSLAPQVLHEGKRLLPRPFSPPTDEAVAEMKVQMERMTYENTGTK